MRSLTSRSTACRASCKEPVIRTPSLKPLFLETGSLTLRRPRLKKASRSKSGKVRYLCRRGEPVGDFAPPSLSASPLATRGSHSGLFPRRRCGDWLPVTTSRLPLVENRVEKRAGRAADPSCATSSITCANRLGARLLSPRTQYPSSCGQNLAPTRLEGANRRRYSRGS